MPEEKPTIVEVIKDGHEKLGGPVTISNEKITPEVKENFTIVPNQGSETSKVFPKP